MRKNNRKGFTIVELVIVIAVIAILAGVLIPTFAGIVEKANKSAALQEATSAYKVFLSESEDANISGDGNPDAYIKIVDGKDTYYFSVENGKIEEDADVTDIKFVDSVSEDTAAGTYYVKDAKNTNVYLYTVVSAAPAEEGGEDVATDAPADPGEGA